MRMKDNLVGGYTSPIRDPDIKTYFSILFHTLFHTGTFRKTFHTRLVLIAQALANAKEELWISSALATKL